MPAAKRTAACSSAIAAPPSLLVGERREAPQLVGRLDVEVVDGARNEGEQEAERSRDDERGEEVHRARACRDAVRLVVERGPPEEEPGHEVGHVLDVEERLGSAERRVVDGRYVPEEVRAGPQRKSDERMREQPGDGEVRREPEHAERRRPLGEDDVLEQVHREQVVERDRVQRRREDDQDQREPGREAGDPPARHAVAPDDEQVPDRERRNEDDSLEIQRPGVRIVHAPDATL